MTKPSPHRPPSTPRTSDSAVVALSLIALLALLPFSMVEAQTSKVFALNSDDPEAVLEAVRGLYGDRATIVLAKNRLVVRADDRVVEQIADLLTKLDPAPRRLLFTLAVGLPRGDEGVETYATRNTRFDGQRLNGVEGVPVVLANVRTTERPVIAPWGWWIAIEDAPADAESIELVATVKDRQVTLDARYRLKRSEQWQTFQATVSGPLGAWLPLLTWPGDAPHGRRTLSTAAGPASSLSAKVEDASRRAGDE